MGISYEIIRFSLKSNLAFLESEFGLLEGLYKYTNIDKFSADSLVKSKVNQKVHILLGFDFQRKHINIKLRDFWNDSILIIYSIDLLNLKQDDRIFSDR